MAGLQEQLRKAEQRKAKEEDQATSQIWGTAISIGTTLLGAFMGKRTITTTNIGRAASSVRSASKLAKERSDVGYAEDNVEAVQQRLVDLDAEFKTESEKIQSVLDAEALSLEEITLQPKKSDITINQVALVWTPWSVSPDGIASPLA